MSQEMFEPIKIEESLKVTYYMIVAIACGFLIFLIILSATYFPNMTPETAIVAGSVIWSIGIFIIFIMVCTFKGFLKPRYFEMNDQFIFFKVPYRPEFQIRWSSFENLEITKDSRIIGRNRRIFFTIFFKSGESVEEFKFEKGRDYRLRTTKIILKSLEEWAPYKQKGFEKNKE